MLTHTTVQTPRSQLRVVAACSAALFAPLTFPLVTGRVFTKDDLAAMHLPFRYIYQEALRSRDSWLWTPAFRSGLYLHGEGEGRFAHPLHVVLYRSLPLGAAFNLEILTSYGAMLIGTAALFARFRMSTETAWFGAMLFTFGGFNLFNLMHVNHIAAVAHMPWVLLFAHVLLTDADRRKRAWAFAGVAVVAASQVLVGNPQYVWLTYVALGYLCICLLFGGARPSRLLLLAGALALGTLMGAVQLVPTLDFVRASTRLNWSTAQALSFSLLPLNVVQLWSPFAFHFRVAAPPSEAFIVHEFIVYNGAFCTVALAWVALRWRQQARRPLLTALLVFAALTLVLAFGRYGGVYPWLAQLPGWRSFRAPARHLVLFQWALSAIAAIAFEDLLSVVRRGEVLAPRRLWPLAVPAALSVAITGFAVALSGSSWAAARDLSFSGFMRAAPWSALVVVMTALVAMTARGMRAAVPIVIALAAFDLGLWGFSYAYRWGPLQRVEDLAAMASVPPGAQPGDLIAPMNGGSAVNLPLLRGLRLTTGYTGLEPSSVLDPADPLTERLAGAKFRPDGTGWIRIAGSMPRARLLSAAEPSRDVAADVRRIDIARVALVDRPIVSLAAPPGSARVLEDRPGALAIETNAPGPQLLVVTERYHDGWRGAEDGRASDTLRVYGDYLGVIVSGGRHRVTLTFEPDSARAGLLASLAGVALTALATAFLWPIKARAARRLEHVAAK